MIVGTTSEASAFFATIAAEDGYQLTACGSWRVHEIVAHLAAGAAEITRNLKAYTAGGANAVPPTRGFDEREQPYRAMAFGELRDSLHADHDQLTESLSTVLNADPNAVTPWTGRQMPVRSFITHMRSEFALHRWDIIGDDETSTELLSQEDLTHHAVHALGPALVARGARNGAAQRVVLTCPGRQPIGATTNGLAYLDYDPHDDTVVLTADDPAARLLVLWGRTPNRPGRLQSNAPDFQQGGKLLAGY